MSLSAVTKRPVRGGSTPRIMEMTGRKSHTAVGDQVPNQFEDSPNTVMGGSCAYGLIGRGGSWVLWVANVIVGPSS